MGDCQGVAMLLLRCSEWVLVHFDAVDEFWVADSATRRLQYLQTRFKKANPQESRK